MEYYLGISMAPASTVDTGVAIMDSFGKIILVDKLYSMKDIQFFLDNYSSLKQSHICISLPWDNSMLEGKWRILSKPYQMVQSNEHFLNREKSRKNLTRINLMQNDYFNKSVKMVVNQNFITIIKEVAIRIIKHSYS